MRLTRTFDVYFGNPRGTILVLRENLGEQTEALTKLPVEGGAE